MYNMFIAVGSVDIFVGANAAKDVVEGRTMDTVPR
jgi:hypothetical protein